MSVARPVVGWGGTDDAGVAGREDRDMDGFMVVLGLLLAQVAEFEFDMTVPEVQQWWGLAALLPVLIGPLIGWIVKQGGTKQQQAAVAMAVYFAYGLVGCWLSGYFDALTWATPLEVLVSLMAVASLGYGSYQTLWRAVPLPQLLEAKAGGDPLVQERPGRNVA